MHDAADPLDTGPLVVTLTGPRQVEVLRSPRPPIPPGHVRLRKYVETENVEERIPLTHEEVVIEREPIRDGQPGTYEIGEDEQEITLHEERPVVGKETRPVEHVRVHKERVQHEETVQGQVRREHLEVDEDGNVRDRTRNRGDEPPPRR